MVKMAPSVLSADFSRLGEQIMSVENAGADWIHLDIMDGHFVPNITFGPLIIAGIRKLTTLPLDAHLMIENADDYLESFSDAGVDQITVHVEACPHLWATIDKIHSLGRKAGVTLNPATPVSLLEPVLHKVELVLVMTVEPGFGGQQFIPEMLDKIVFLHDFKRQHALDYEIQVDGGINETTAPSVVKAGATVLVAGSSIFDAAHIADAFQRIKNSAAVAAGQMT
ncbi:ribulose-phosphate 3-epimerase [candidate division KSB1 bacterium]|nr:ribulose-phosphate 3-epimerase [candidate division KSB1 bacterium]RQW07007.1 MAG: ribulose-phosphate 3-epimerase [candidate division KSB1 bacterium]